jgi:transposase
MNATEPTFPVSGPPAVWIGMDIAKDTFEACLLRTSGKRGIKSFANDATGIAKLQRWVASLDEKQPCHSCMEATGNYYLAAALALAEAEQTVSVVNPFRIKHAGFTYGQGNKTDKADARTLAQFCRKEQPAPWRAAAPEVRLLTALLRRVDSLQVQHVAEQNRLQDPGLLDVVRTSIQSSLDFLSAEMARLHQQITDHIDQHPQLRADKELLQSIPGVGALTAHGLLAELPDVKQFDSAQDAAAFAGLNPCEYQSGKSVHKKTRLSKRGSVYLRKCLYMPALSAQRYNPCIAALCQRLQERGLAKKAVLGAAMRKLLMLAYGVLRNQQKFDKV